MSDDKTSRDDVRLMRFLRHVGLAQRQPDWRRLRTDIANLQAWVNSHKCDTAAKEAWSSRPWVAVCEDNLAKAQQAADEHNVPTGYEYLHIAERESVPGMSQHEGNVRAQSLRVEIPKFDGSWRAEAMKKALGENGASVTAEALAEAIWQRNTADRNGQRKTDKLRWQLAWLGVLVGLMVLLAFAFAVFVLPADPFVAPQSSTTLESVRMLPYCIYLGLLGGLVSSAISVKGTDRKARVPEVEVAFYAALTRSLLGAAASIPVYVIAKAGLITIGSKASEPWGLLLLCFVSGFSERWFLKAVATVSDDDNGKRATSSKK